MSVTQDVDQLLREGPIVVNIGPRQFGDSVRDQDAEVVQVDWTPPAGGDTELAQLLDELM
jgi:hypothetical protein